MKIGILDTNPPDNEHWWYKFAELRDKGYINEDVNSLGFYQGFEEFKNGEAGFCEIVSVSLYDVVSYMGEDKELEARLRRRGAKFGLVPDGLVSVLRTPAKAKLANFGSDLTKREMMTIGTALRKENKAAGLLVANEGVEWGV